MCLPPDVISSRLSDENEGMAVSLALETFPQTCGVSSTTAGALGERGGKGISGAEGRVDFLVLGCLQSCQCVEMGLRICALPFAFLVCTKPSVLPVLCSH